MKAMLPTLSGSGVQLLKVVGFITGSVIAGEALALLVGMFLLSPRPNSWITWRNILFLGLDIVCGVGMIVLMLIRRDFFGYIFLSALVLIAFSSHVYREWEYFASSTIHRFLINLPLFVLNNVKLVGIIAMAGIMLMSI